MWGPCPGFTRVPSCPFFSPSPLLPHGSTSTTGPIPPAWSAERGETRIPTKRVDQPARRDSDSRRGQRGLNSRLRGTQPAGAGSRDSTCRPGGTHDSCAAPRGSTSGPGGTQPPGTLRGCGAGTDGLAGFRLRTLGRGSTRRPSGTQPPGRGPRCLTCGSVGPRLRTRGRGGRPAGPTRLRLRARVPCLHPSACRPFPTPRGLGRGRRGWCVLAAAARVAGWRRSWGWQLGPVRSGRARLPATPGKFCRVPVTGPPRPESPRSSFPVPLPLARSRRGGREL